MTLIDGMGSGWQEHSIMTNARRSRSFQLVISLPTLEKHDSLNPTSGKLYMFYPWQRYNFPTSDHAILTKSSNIKETHVKLEEEQEDVVAEDCFVSEDEEMWMDVDGM
jgi:hypothetical protein